MAIRRGLNIFKGRVKDNTLWAFEDAGGNSSAHPTDTSTVLHATLLDTDPVFDPPFAAVLERVSVPPRDRPAATDFTWTCLGAFVEVLDKGSCVFGPLKVVMDDFAQCIGIHENAMATQREYQTLRMQLEKLLSDLSNHFTSNAPPTMTVSMENLCRAIENELDHISIKDKRGARVRHLEARQDLDDVLECYRRIQSHLERLALNADLCTWKIVDEQATETRLRTLAPSMSACYNSAEATLVRRRECTPNTRQQVLAEMSSWRHNQQQGNLYWLNGMAGTGKTTVAHSLCVMLDRTHALGASFFCTRLLPECRNVKLILPTIAYQLARLSHPFRCALSRVLEHDPDIYTRALSNQFDRMIIGPLRKVTHTLPTDLAVVIDALDECDDNHEIGQLLEILVKHASKLPIKVFVSSRPEPQIRMRIGRMDSQLILHELNKSIVRNDIETYFRVELASISLSQSQLAALVERAGALFIYAATVVRYIGAEDFSLNPKKRLSIVLGASASISSHQNKDIDALYSAVLDSAFNNPNLEFSDKVRMKLVLDTVVCAQEPLSVNVLAGLLRVDDVDWVHAALRPLWSVLHISGASSLVTTLHVSFVEYMLDAGRSKEYGFDARARHEESAVLCFERISRHKRQFNVCELNSSYVPDEQVPDLEWRVQRAIPSDLTYACCYWAVHLELGGKLNKLTQQLEEFLSMRLLMWMEVLNLKNRMNIGAVLLEKARNWCIAVDCSEDLKDLVYDAWRFVTMFAANPVSCSTPHIYVSMLASWPRWRPLANHYIRRTKGLAVVGGSGVTRRQLALLGAFTCRSAVESISLSSDGTRIVSGYRDATVCVWDAQVGQMVLGPLVGHTASVNSVAFSSDGTRIASGSEDTTIRIWDAQSGQMVLGPLEGHTSWVTSVALSPDGEYIVSGSYDETIRLWDTQSGQMVLGPLEGHADWVMSVAFSPDGLSIASGSNNTTICVWDVQCGQVVLGPLQDTGSVMSVAFSPDGTRLVSGSGQNTICVWDAQSGQRLLGPLEKHTLYVTSVAFSPDSKHIVSGSYDKTIRVWDVQSGQIVLGPLEGHGDWVKSVAFSSDGMRIISGSLDKTVCVWDSKIEQTSAEPLEGHSARVHSVAFSPDGTYIVSGSNDTKIRMWDAQNGQMIRRALEGHTGSVYAIAISSDSTCIISGSSDSTVRVWDARTGQMVLGPLKGHADSVMSVAISPAGTCIVSGSHDSTACVWDKQSGQLIHVLRGHTGSVMSVAFSPSGTRIVSGSHDQTIRVWGVRRGQMVLGPLQGHASTVYSVAFSPDCTYIVSGSLDKTVCVWDTQCACTVLGPPGGHTSWVTMVAFSPDNKRVIAGFGDMTIRVWDVQSRQLVGALPPNHSTIVISMALSSDGSRIVSGSDDQILRVWHVPSGPTAVDLPPCSSSAPPLSVANNTITQAQHLQVTPGPFNSTSYPWAIDGYGQVLDNRRRLLLWVPPDLRSRLLTPENSLLISAQGSIKLNFDHAKLGEAWTECYLPA